jgi:hypothetical protein
VFLCVCKFALLQALTEMVSMSRFPKFPGKGIGRHFWAIIHIFWSYSVAVYPDVVKSDRPPVSSTDIREKFSETSGCYARSPMALFANKTTPPANEVPLVGWYTPYPFANGHLSFHHYTQSYFVWNFTVSSPISTN